MLLPPYDTTAGMTTTSAPPATKDVLIRRDLRARATHYLYVAASAAVVKPGKRSGTLRVRRVSSTTLAHPSSDAV